MSEYTVRMTAGSSSAALDTPLQGRPCRKARGGGAAPPAPLGWIRLQGEGCLRAGESTWGGSAPSSPSLVRATPKAHCPWSTSAWSVSNLRWLQNKLPLWRVMSIYSRSLVLSPLPELSWAGAGWAEITPASEPPDSNVSQEVGSYKPSCTYGISSLHREKSV